MGKRKRQSHYFLLLFCGLASLLAGRTQDLHFSQFYEAPLVRNPALAGIFTGNLRVQTLYRDQWNSVTTAYRTFSLNAEYKVPVGKGDDFFTAGLQLLNDRAGTVSWVTNQVLPAINYHKSLSNEKNRYLSLGFMAGRVERRFDRTRMTTNSMFNGGGDGENFLQPKYSYWDASVGMSYNSQLGENSENNFYLGTAYHHLNKPKASFFNDPSVMVTPRWAAQAGVRMAVTPVSYLTIQADGSSQGSYNELLIGALYGMKVGADEEAARYILHGGVFMRLQDAIIPVVKVERVPFAFSLSYDVNISRLKSSSYGRGGFEMGISFAGFTSQNSTALNAVLCPRF